MKPRLHIVIVNWNSGELLRRCLESISGAQTRLYRLERITVIDNASDDGSARDLSFSALPLEVVYNQVNRGYAAACNQGAAGSNADYLLFLNPDVRLFAESISAPLAFLEEPRNCKIAILGIRLFDDTGVLQRSCARFPTAGCMLGQSLGLDRVFPRLVAPHFMREWAHDETRAVDQVMGAYFLVRREAYMALGGFDERFFVYFDDVDLCLRVQERGWQTVYFADAAAVHVGCGTTASVPSRRLFYSLRSRVLFARKHFGAGGQALVLLGTVLFEPWARIMRAVWRGSAQEVRDVVGAMTLLSVAAIRRTPAGTR